MSRSHSFLTLFGRLTYLPQHWLLMLAGLYLIVILALPWNNHGGYGLSLPYNSVCWIFMALMVLPVALTRRQLRISRCSLWITGGALLMTLPVLWSPSSDGVLASLPRLAGMWGGVFFYFCLLQVRTSLHLVQCMLVIVACATVVQTIGTLVCLWQPDWLPWTLRQLAEQYGSSGFGIFQQRNVNASFLATGLMAMLALLAFRPSRWPIQVLMGFAIVVVSVTLVLIQSRIGWIGGLTGIMGIVLLARTSQGKENSDACIRGMLLLLPLLGVLLGTLLLPPSLTDSLRAHEGSNSQRWMTLKYTTEMIMQHPWRGWGMGMFKGEFQRYMAALQHNPSHELMGHPHNEILYQWFEGGITALAGGLCCVVAWLLLVRRRKHLWRSVVLLMTLPVLLHTQVEYPLYFSAPHFMLLLLLLRMADRGTYSVRFSRCSSVLISGALASFVLYGMVLSLQCLHASLMLDKFESGQLDNPESITTLPVPWVMAWRQQHELTMLHLVRFTDTRDVRELAEFVKSNPRWLTIEQDPDAQQNQLEAEKYILASKNGL